MPIPRNWSEELVSEWLQLEGYLTEVGVPLPGTGKGGRQEADVVGAKISENAKGVKFLQIYHVEIGELGGNYERNIEKLRNKFSVARIQAIVKRFSKRIGSVKNYKYEKVYVDIWPTKRKVEKLMNHTDIKKQKIKVWTPEKFFQEVYQSIVTWIPEHGPKRGEATLPESYWMLKQLEHLREWGLLNIEES